MRRAGSLLGLVLLGAATLAALLAETAAPRARTPRGAVATLETAATGVSHASPLAARAVDVSRVGLASLVAVASSPPAPAACGTIRLLVNLAGGDRPASGVDVVATVGTWSRTAVTGLDGRVELQVPPGRVSFDVRSPGASCDGWSWGFHPGEVRDYTLLLFPAGGVVRGTVVDPGGRPVVGARVCWDLASTTTDARGEFSLVGLAEDERCLTVLAAGFSPGGERVFAERSPGTSLRVELRAEVRLEGTVAPVGTGGPTEWFVDVNPGDHWAPALDVPVVDGRFAIEGLVGGRTYLVLVRGVDASGGVWATWRTLSLEPTGTTRPAFEPLRPGSVAGRVVRRGGSPEGLVVTVSWPGWRGDATRRMEVGADGAFELGNVPSGRVWVGVRSTKGPLGNESAQVQVGPGETSSVDLVLGDEGFEVRGQVVDRAGAPLESAYVELVLVGDEDVHAGTNADEQGRFVIRGLPVGRWRVYAKGGGRICPPSEVAVGPGATPGELRLVAGLAAGLSLRVVDGGGGPVPFARLRVRRLDGVRDGWVPLTDHGGRGELAGLTPGQVRIELDDELYRAADVLERVARLRGVNGTRCDPVTVELRAGESSEVVLRVVDVP